MGMMLRVHNIPITFVSIGYINSKCNPWYLDTNIKLPLWQLPLIDPHSSS